MTEKPNRTAEMADILHQASMLYMASNFPIDYGTGTKYTSVEVHMLKYIIDHPGKISHRALPRMGPHQAGDLPDVKTAWNRKV